MFQEIPLTRPATPLLDRIDSPADLRRLDEAELATLALQLREFLLYTVGQTGGHFGAGLGVVELTVALHYIYNTPDDRLVWDVGHQCYPHKILTGRRERMNGMRKAKGLAGFPKREESPYDTFGVGHSSTSISAALGMAIAARQQNIDRHTVAVIGDGAMTAGMAFEAITHATHTGANMLVILNDNQMSISKSTGGLNTYFSRMWASKTYNQIRSGGKTVLKKFPRSATDLAARLEEYMKGMVSPATLFEELGFNYIGPIDGHDLDVLVPTLRNLRELPGPQMLHIRTQKGKGFGPAEEDPVGFHAISKIEPKPSNGQAPIVKPTLAKYQDIFGRWLCDQAEQSPELVAITPAMCEGSGMLDFSERFADRFYDVAIAEQHALTLAAGMACDGLKPVVAIYSTFLQRAYDQLIHDIALQNLDVTFGIDRAGLVGEDGPTHAGAFDLSFLRCIPNMIVMAPADENETRQMLHTAYHYPGPAAVRYPRGTGPGVSIEQDMQLMEIGKGRIQRQGQKIAILSFGTLLASALNAADELDATVADMRFVKPLDTDLIDALADDHDLLVTLEENVIAGGAGSAVSEYLNQQNRWMPVMQLGLPDAFIDHGKHAQLLSDIGLDTPGILASIRQRTAQIAMFQGNSGGAAE
ncbi:1-deoxy-D-xylulose-5-phosphate synthase [gamma proteobacterium BDW918]|jgi:1-deoxy-D-xylulose-5-phosphate synthase|uniref:1-deoxy-D-xylulose-5-phosphate synthase n=1 Tax=Zhongshania aliphaticivorans TaxID=1470434 RepID=A0A127M9I8_9GAMM|nr:1-deoxy-D-xylulose-5-phosphate synthase [Zhongshania aliphaticivorans]AMO69838.1 1-deoxy-D-xylulose-5-phosphate synthase [Zhongshania aliphaticivorans]EIF41959.1 1-deoxy-D-xylulose-5-phosphate synthase [gamma proteobacterium BDW918]